jgi:hypothetical protein
MNLAVISIFEQSCTVACVQLGYLENDFAVNFVILGTRILPPGGWQVTYNYWYWLLAYY